MYLLQKIVPEDKDISTTTTDLETSPANQSSRHNTSHTVLIKRAMVCIITLLLHYY